MLTSHQPSLGRATYERRAFLKHGLLNLTAISSFGLSAGLADDRPADKPSIVGMPGSDSGTKAVVRIAIMTDLHYADKDAAGTRYYRETLSKLDEAAEFFQANRPDVLVELGDLIDAADDVEKEQRYLATINRPFSSIAADRHYVLGNHCVDTLTKDEFLAGVQRDRSYYSFDRCGIHFIVLDSCFRSDGVAYGRRNFQWTDPNIPPEELEWLHGDLQNNRNPVVVFAHQRLDVTDNHGVKNAAEVRAILEKSGNVTAVFQGHSHKNDLRSIGGIFYCTLVAMIEGSGKENNGYSMMEVSHNGSIVLNGFRNQMDREFRTTN